MSHGLAASGTQSAVRSDMTHDQDTAWTDTIDDWERVLTADTSDTTAGTPSTTSEIDRIDPISEPLIDATTAVLPDTWLTSTDTQRLVQWVVYTFVEQTNAKLSTSVRVKTAIDRVADRTDANAVRLRQFCTRTLYRGHSGSGKHNFRADLQAIEAQTR